MRFVSGVDSEMTAEKQIVQICGWAALIPDVPTANRGCGKSANYSLDQFPSKII